MNDFALPFSVSMCVYGKDDPQHFKTAVESILQQTVVPDEIVLVVDGPVPEKLGRLIDEFEQMKNFSVIRLSVNQGHGNARRIGLNACKYDLVALMDSDDISTADRFEKELTLFKSDSKLGIVGGNITEFVDSPQNITGYRNVPSGDTEIKSYLKTRCPMNQVTVMFKKSEVEKAGGYVDWFCEEDYYLWVRLALNGTKFANIDAVLVNVRVGKDMYLRRGGLKYFKSEAKLQKFMLRKKVISVPTCFLNCAKRFVVQVLLPNKLREWVFQKFAREKENGKQKV